MSLYAVKMVVAETPDIYPRLENERKRLAPNENSYDDLSIFFPLG